jgi:hypothetical protein
MTMNETQTPPPHGIPGLDAEGLVIRESATAGSGFFPGNPEVDRLLAMITALTGEIAILRARLDTHERLAANGSFDRASVEAYVPTATELAERMADDQAMIARVFRPVADELDRLLADSATQKSLIGSL